MIVSRLAMWVMAACVVLGLASALAGCGKRGAPQPPPGARNTYPQPYPRD
jgi:predicted small lipoprotein YifL